MASEVWFYICVCYPEGSVSGSDIFLMRTLTQISPMNSTVYYSPVQLSLALRTARADVSLGMGPSVQLTPRSQQVAALKTALLPETLSPLSWGPAAVSPGLVCTCKKANQSVQERKASHFLCDRVLLCHSSSNSL